jgi:hypothetical protein
MYLKLMIDGATSKPFSATTTAIPKSSNSYKSKIIYISREQYGRAKEVVEAEINSRYTENKNAFGSSQDSLFS